MSIKQFIARSILTIVAICLSILIVISSIHEPKLAFILGGALCVLGFGFLMGWCMENA